MSDPPLHLREGALVEFRVVRLLTNRVRSGGPLCGITVLSTQHDTAAADTHSDTQSFLYSHQDTTKALEL